MKKSEKRKLEEQIRLALLEESMPDDAHMDEVWQRARRAYLNEEKPAKRHGAARGICRRVMVVAAATAAILVVSFWLSVVRPVQVGSANNTTNEVLIWLNDKFRLGLNISVPAIDEPGIELDTSETFDSFAAALKKLEVSLIGLNDGTNWKFKELIATKIDQNVYRYESFYTKGDNHFAIEMKNFNDENTVAVLAENAIELETEIGNIIYWEAENEYRAFGVIEGYSVRIFSDAQLEEFIDLCEELQVFKVH